MDEAWKEARRSELWDSIFRIYRDPARTDGRSRLEVSIDLLMDYKETDNLVTQIKNAGGEISADDHLVRSANAYMIWQLISLDLAQWTLQEIVDLERVQSSEVSSRSKLLMFLGSQVVAQWPGHGQAIDPMPVFLPRPILIELLEALKALNRGETLPILQPTSTGRHGATWDWDVMRTRALQYVEFYRGQGQSKKNAQKIVSLATGISVNTLKDWEYSINPTESISPAFEAGRIKQRREADPTYGRIGGEPASAFGMDYLNNQLAQPLSEFGRAYQDRFGHRHNPGSSDGD